MKTAKAKPNINNNKCLNSNSPVFVEVFDRDALRHIVRYEEYYKKLLDCDEDKKYAQFELYKKYLKKASGELGNHVCVSYHKNNNKGRLFADKSLSLQSFNKLVRGTISKDLYYDVDIENAHPVILKKMCKDRGFLAYHLNLYVEMRDLILEDLMKINPDKTRGEIKQIILSIIYGGFRDYDNLKVKSDWIIGFYDEMRTIHNKVKDWFPEEYNNRVQSGRDFNATGSTLSIEISCVENDILQTMVEYLKKNKLCEFILVLCFDGVMIHKTAEFTKEDLLNHISKMERLIEKDHGVNVRLIIKDFKTLSLDIPEEFQLEEKELEDEESVECVDNIKEIYKSSKYYWFDFVQDMTKDVFGSYEDLCDTFKKNIKKVAMKVFTMDDHLIRKIDSNNMFQFDKKIPNHVFKYYKLVFKTVQIKSISLNTLLNSGEINNIPMYNQLTFKPRGVFEDCHTLGEFEDDRLFNTWTSFKARLVDKVDMDKIEIVLNHIKKVWCSDNDEYYQYILSWFKLIFINPSLKTKVAVILKSSDKQIGKGILINDFLIPYVFGETYSMSLAGLDTVTSKFNQILMNKLFINCDELSTIDGSYHQSFDVLKKRITDRTVKIEIKGGKSFIYPDYCNYLMCTNNDFTIRMEQGDARYFVLDCSPCYKGNFGYFKKLSDSLNQETADHFFTYVASLISNIDVRNIPMTELKRSMMINSLPSCIRFLMAFNEDYKFICHDCDRSREESKYDDIYVGCDGCECEEYWISFNVLYDKYVKWCQDFKENSLSKNKFGRNIASYINKKKSTGIKVDLLSIKVDL